MKMMKLALLGGAALAVSAIGAQADDLSALKAEIEALNARVAQLEATPSVPAGYQLMTIRESDAMTVPGLDTRDPGYGTKATVISILPTADAPSSTSIEWSGYARAILMFTSNADVDGDGEPDDMDIFGRGQLKVVGKTDTAVGEVGALVQLRANSTFVDTKGTFVSNEYWGWWAMTPEVTLGGGYTGSLGNIGYGLDGACNCYGTDNFASLNPGDATQMRLSWASGPISAAVAVEDGSDDDADLDATPPVLSVSADSLAVAGEVKYSGDMVNGEVSAIWRDGVDRGDDFWQAGAGIGFALGDMASISAGAALGHEYDGNDFWKVSALASANLSDSVHAEIAYQHDENDSGVADIDTALAGIYYDPVAQLTIGLEAEWATQPGADAMVGDLVTVFRF